MKLLGPKISRQTMAETKASHAGRRLSAPSICSIRITMKRAVSAKSMPVVLKGACSNQRTDDAQNNPIGDGQKRRQHIRPFFIDIRLEMMRTVRGIIFIRQGIDEEIFPRPEGAEFFR